MINVRHILLAIVLLPTAVRSADNVPDASRTVSERVAEPSPEVLQMRKYTDCEVSYAAGTTSFTIPLMEVSTPTLKIPLTLHYRCEAKKVEEPSGYIGLGWALTGLGSVSRQICGQPDDKEIGYLELKSTEAQLSNEYFSDLLNLRKDSDYDRYTIVTPAGESASFIITSEGLKMLSPTELKVWYESSGKNKLRPESFKARSSDGTYYEFTRKEEVEYTYYPTLIVPDFINPNYSAVTAWHLTKISNPARTDSITIEYTDGGTWKRRHGSVYLRSMSYHQHLDTEHSYISGDEGDEPDSGEPWDTLIPIDRPIIGDKDLTKESAMQSVTGTSTNYIAPPLPRTINWNGGRITFSFVDDVGTKDECNGTANRLESMTMTDPQGQTVRQVSFTNGTFGDGRRYLKSLSIKGDTELLEAYSFSYKNHAKSDSKDFFGYPNGSINDLKRHSVLSCAKLKLSKSRYSDARYITDGILTSIKSSTGLETSFEYEPSEITNTDTLSIFGPEVTVGVRLKKITVQDLKNKRKRIREFSYYQPVMTADVTSLRHNAFLGSSGYKSPDLYLILLSIIYDMSVTFTGSSREPGMPAESARILYGRVEENVTGTDIDSPVRTVYEYDLSECVATVRPIGNGRLRPPVNMEKDQDLLYFDKFLVSRPTREWVYRKVFGLNTIRSYFGEVIGGEPMLVKKTTYRKEGSEYKADESRTYSYEVCDRRETVVGFYREFMGFKYNREDGSAMTMVIDWENNVDFGWVKTESKRIILTGSKTTRHYSNGHERTIASDYIYEPRIMELPRLPDSLLIRNSKKIVWGYHPGFNTPLFAPTEYSKPFRPFGVSYSHGGDTLTRYDLYSGQRMPSGFDTDKDPLYLPVATKWVSMTGGRCDSILDESDYARFHGLLLPKSQVISRNGAIIDKAEYTAYQKPGLLTRMTDRTGRTINFTWDSYGYLTGKTITGIPGATTYTNKALVGCTSITLPSGKKRSFGYDNGRLSWERNTADSLVASYSYSMAWETPWALSGKPTGENAISVSKSTGGGEATTKSIYDGFGLKIKDIAEGFGGNGGDVVTQTDYDGLDRPLRVWQPYPATSTATTYYQDTHPYAAGKYASDGSDFVVSATSPGERMQGHPSQHSRLCNTDAGLLAVRHYTVENGLLTYSGNYPAGELEAIKSVDPDGHTTIVFSDWRGRTILTRRMLSEGEYADTYTVYDHWGNPVAVVPPLGTKHLATKGEKYKLTDPMIAHVQNYLYIYSYDDALRLISAKAPGVEAVTTTYDPNGLVAFTDDGNLRKSGRTRFTLYDSAARPVVTGLCDAPSGTSAVPSMHASISGTGIDKTGYSATYAQLQNANVLTATYYDSNTPPDISKIQSYTSKYSSKAGLIRGTLERVMDSGQFITTLYNYDSEERIIGRASTTHTDKVMLIVNTSYNIDGSVAGSETILVHPTGPHFDRRTFGYDKHGRLTSVKQSLDDRPEVTLWTGTYNAIGQLATASTGLFTENLAYEVDGTQKSRTSGVFSQQISRDGLYNGSISRITDTLNGKQSTASYTYDNLDRLIAADIKIGGRDRSAGYSYDLNGNITSLTRKGDDGSDIGRLIDDLTLSYTGNQLKDVTEYAAPVLSEATMNFAKSNVSQTPYKYDSNGNLTADPNKGASYVWDANNRLQGIDYGEKKASINITRSASGAKLAETSEKFVMGAGFSRITNARHYYGPFEYLDNNLARVNVSGGYIDASGKFHAYVTDWQGNVRAVVSKEFTGPVIEQSTWYYPYGMPTCDGRHPSVNRYKYTGKELITDNATNLYDYPARLYDPTLCRWITTDPLTHENAPVSHYSMCASDPINHIDPTGLDWVETPDGKIYWREDIDSNDYTSKLSNGEIYRGASYERDRIWIDIDIEGNSESGLMTEYYMPYGHKWYKNNTPWIDVAVEEMKKNISETGFGSNPSNPEITKYFDYTQLKDTPSAKTDQTAWCAAFVNYCLETSGVAGTMHAGVYTFYTWGQSISESEPKFGAIAIMDYSHVGFVIGKNKDGRIVLLGGNQNDAINMSPNSMINVKKFVYPTNYTPTSLPLPPMNIKRRSLNFNSSR